MLGVRAAKSCNNIGYKVCRLHELRSSVARRSGVLNGRKKERGSTARELPFFMNGPSKK